MNEKENININETDEQSTPVQTPSGGIFVERLELDDAPPAAPAVPHKQAIPVSARGREESRMELYDWLQCLVGALLIGIFVFMFIGRQVEVNGDSMYPTLHNGDRIVTSRLFYTPEQGDIVVVQTNTFDGEPIVKRIIATEGQTVDIDFRQGAVYVDGVILEEDYINELTLTREDFAGPVTVPEGCVFLLGDNRNDSEDSRSNRVGMVDERSIIGKVYFIIVPGVEENTNSRLWSRFGSAY